MKRYEQYKNCEVQWLKEIPSHWEVKKFKYLTSYMQSGTNLTAIQIKDHGKFPVYGGNGRRGFYDEANWMKSCIIIGRQGALCGNVHIVKEPIWATDHAVITMNNKTTDIDYLFYLALTMNFNQYASQTAAQPGLSVGIIKNVSTCLPPLSDQHTIVTYLDTKVNKIDSYIATAEKKIAALDELKKVTIANAVTHGIHPNVPMKDSGIKWIGEVPKHWEIRKLSQVAFEHYISNKTIHHQNLLSLSYGKIIRKDINTTDGLLPASFDGYQIIEPGNIILRLTDLQNDHRSLRVGLVPEVGIITSAYLCLGVRIMIKSNYLYFQLHSYDIKKLFYSMGDGLRQSLNYEGIRKLFIVVPPLSEQEEIVSYINHKVAQIDKMRNAELAQIEKLKEYKQRLISDVVTGKVKV